MIFLGARIARAGAAAMLGGMTRMTVSLCIIRPPHPGASKRLSRFSRQIGLLWRFSMGV